MNENTIVLDKKYGAECCLELAAIKERICTGYERLDKIMPLAKGEVTVITAVPKMGATGLLLNLLNNLSVLKDYRSVYYTTDESPYQLTGRLISRTAEVPEKELAAHDLRPSENERIGPAIERITRGNIFICGKSRSDDSYCLDDLWNQNGFENPDVLFIDTLNSLSAGLKGNLSLKQTCYGLKELAIKRNVAIIAAYRLGKQVNNRGGHRPVMSLDFEPCNDSSCDTVAYIYRDAYYKREATFKDMMELTVTNRYLQAACTDGTESTVHFKSDCDTGKLTEWM